MVGGGEGDILKIKILEKLNYYENTYGCLQKDLQRSSVQERHRADRRGSQVVRAWLHHRTDKEIGGHWSPYPQGIRPVCGKIAKNFDQKIQIDLLFLTTYHPKNTGDQGPIFRKEDSAARMIVLNGMGEYQFTLYQN